MLIVYNRLLKRILSQVARNHFDYLLWFWVLACLLKNTLAAKLLFNQWSDFRLPLKQLDSLVRFFNRDLVFKAEANQLVLIPVIEELLESFPFVLFSVVHADVLLMHRCHDVVFKKNFVLGYCGCVRYMFIENTNRFLFLLFASAVGEHFSNPAFFQLENFNFQLVFYPEIGFLFLYWKSLLSQFLKLINLFLKFLPFFFGQSLL